MGLFASLETMYRKSWYYTYYIIKSKVGSQTEKSFTRIICSNLSVLKWCTHRGISLHVYYIHTRNCSPPAALAPPPCQFGVRPNRTSRREWRMGFEFQRYECENSECGTTTSTVEESAAKQRLWRAAHNFPPLSRWSRREKALVCVMGASSVACRKVGVFSRGEKGNETGFTIVV